MQTADHLKMTASLVVLLVDDFTGKTITGGSVRVSIAEQKPPVRKNEGYYVFINLPVGELEVTAEGGVYETKRIMVTTGTDGNQQVLRLRLTPGRAYPIPADATSVEGVAEPNSTVYIISRERAGAMKLLYDYDPAGESNGVITVFHPTGEDISGRQLFVEGNAQQTELFRLGEALAEDGAYALGKALVHMYKKIGTTIYPAFSATVNDKGEFRLPIASLREKEGTFLCIVVGADTRSVEVVLKTGAVQRLDLTKLSGASKLES